MVAVVESAGTTLLKALLSEVRQLPKPWEQTPEREQEVVIDRLRRAVDSAVRQAVGAIAGAGSFQRIQATVDQVVFKDGVKASLSLPKGQSGTHELADAQGNHVLIVIASTAEFLEGMERIKADADQPDMFEEERAERPEPVVPSDGSWQALLDSLEEGPPEDHPEVRSMGAQCQELLAKVHVHVALDICEAWSEQECTVAAYWAIEHAKYPENRTVARPHWLPLPHAIPAGHTRVWGKVDGKDAYVDVPAAVFESVATAWVEAGQDGVPGYDDYVAAMREVQTSAPGEQPTDGDGGDERDDTGGGDAPAEA